MTFFIYIKRMLKHPYIILLLLCLPVLAFIFRGFAAKTEGAKVGIYSKAQAAELIEYLQNNNDVFTFVTYSSEDEMKRDVETQILECGFILPENIADVENISIVCGKGYASVLSEVTKEAVFAAILKVYGDKAALRFAQKSNIDINDENFEKAYQKYAEETAASITFEEIGQGETSAAKKRDIPLCAAAAVLICASLIGAGFYANDKKHGIRFGLEKSVGASVAVFALSAMAAFVLLGKNVDVPRFLIFCFGVFGCGLILSLFIKNEKTAWLFMPVVLVLVFMFDIVGISAVVPALGIVDKLLLSHYLLYENTVRLAVFSAILCGLGVGVNKIF